MENIENKDIIKEMENKKKEFIKEVEDYNNNIQTHINDNDLFGKGWDKLMFKRSKKELVEMIKKTRINNFKNNNISIEKQISTFLFRKEYEDNPSINKQIATIKLEIDHINSRYSILPTCGIQNKGFMFEVSSYKSNMWKAVLELINQAIDFANKELNNDK